MRTPLLLSLAAIVALTLATAFLLWAMEQGWGLPEEVPLPRVKAEAKVPRPAAAPRRKQPSREARDEEQCTPLWVAIDRNAVGVVELLASEAVIDVPNARGTTPLMKALYGEHESTARWLVEQGADVRARGHDGETALHVATAYSTIESVRFLLDRGADVNAVTGFGGSAYDRAESAQRDDVAALLRERGAHVERFRCEEQLRGGATRSFLQRGGCPPGATATPLPRLAP